VPDSRDLSPARASPGVRFLFRALSRRVRPFPLLRTGPLARTGSFQGIRVRLSWGSCSREHNYVGCPFSPLRSFPTASVDEGSCHPLVGAVLRVLAPLDGSGRARGTARTPCEIRRYAVAPRRFAALFHAARVPLELPFRAFPSRGAVPALAGLLLPCEFATDRRQRGNGRNLHDRFPPRGSSLPAVHPRANRDA